MQIVNKTKQKSLQYVNLIIEKSFKRKYNQQRKEMACKRYCFMEYSKLKI